MNLSEILSVLWHRKLVVIGVTALAIGGAVGALKLVTPVYEATSTMALAPDNLGNDLVFFQTIDAIVPIYATAADSRVTLEEARARNGGSLADISVRTFQGAPIFKIDARSTNKSLAQSSASQVASTLRDRVATGGVGIPKLRLTQIDRPTLPTSPVFPNEKLTLAVAALLGLGFGIAAALLLENLTSRVRTRAELAEASGLPVYAVLPQEGALRHDVSPELLTSSPALRSVNEALRDLRTNLSFAGNGEIQTVAVTSPEGSHGKTTIALGLAAAIARSGLRTVLVDADLRRGRVAEMLDVPRVPGLYEAMAGRGLGGGVLRETALPNLSVITGGRLVSDPGELLATRFPELLEELKQSYDAIVVDTTPLVPVNDARIVASHAKATLIVASSGRATRATVEEAVNRLSLIAVKPTAAVLNKSKDRQARTYYGTADVDAAEDRSAVRERV
jgi:capsular exopolysaccharide synthesis family protein